MCVEELQRVGKQMLAEQRSVHTRGSSAVKAIAQVMGTQSPKQVHWCCMRHELCLKGYCAVDSHIIISP